MNDLIIGLFIPVSILIYKVYTEHKALKLELKKEIDFNNRMKDIITSDINKMLKLENIKDYKLRFKSDVYTLEIRLNIKGLFNFNEVLKLNTDTELDWDLGFTIDEIKKQIKNKKGK